METNQNRISLEQRIADWRLSLNNSALTKEDIEELSNHLYDSFEEYKVKGLNDEDAWTLAKHHIGSSKLLDDEFRKVNPDFIASRNWMMMLWGALGLIIFQALFISFPVLIQYIVWPEREGRIRFVNPDTLDLFFNISSLVLIILFLVVLFKGRELTERFNRILSEKPFFFTLFAIILGLFAAFANFLIFNSSLREYTNHLWGNSSRESFNTLMFSLYTSITILTGYFTLRYKSKDLRSVESFNRNINWKTAFALGLLVQIPVQYSFSFKGDLMPIFIAIPLYGLVGWMISYSKKGTLNLFFAQSLPMLLFLFVTFFETSRAIYISYYISPFISLIIGYFYGKRRVNKGFLLE